MRKKSTLLAAVAATGLVAAIIPAAYAASSDTPGAAPHRSAAQPAVTGPVPGTPALAVADYPLAPLGYAESEYLFSGTASAYTSTAPLTADGKWSVKPSTTAAYASRMVVIAPTDPTKFNGTVVVEWLNTTAGFDRAQDWLYGHDELLRSGDAYVGVSVQADGVNALKGADPTRYANLAHPGDSFSYDIFSQAGAAIRSHPQLFGGAAPKVLLATGEGESAMRLTTYADAVAPTANEYDGYLLHSRPGSAAPLSQYPQTSVMGPAAVRIRTDLTTPVLAFETETDVLGLGSTYYPYSTAYYPLGLTNYEPAAQPDSPKFRVWEVAGTSQSDTYTLTNEALEDNLSLSADTAGFTTLGYPPASSMTTGSVAVNCPVAFNSGEQHYVFATAVRDLAAWAGSGTAPPTMPRFTTTGSGRSTAYRRDANGNVLGGIRTPAVDTPIATLSGLPAPKSTSYCLTAGQAKPFKAARLMQLYRTYDAFLTNWRSSAAAAERNGYLLPEDVNKLDAAAAGGKP